MTIINVTQARNDLHNIVKRVLNNDNVTITSKGGNVVVIPESSWEEIRAKVFFMNDPEFPPDGLDQVYRETYYLMCDPEFMNDVREARNTPISEREVWNCRTS